METAGVIKSPTGFEWVALSARSRLRAAASAKTSQAVTSEETSSSYATSAFSNGKENIYPLAKEIKMHFCKMLQTHKTDKRGALNRQNLIFQSGA